MRHTEDTIEHASQLLSLQVRVQVYCTHPSPGKSSPGKGLRPGSGPTSKRHHQGYTLTEISVRTPGEPTQATAPNFVREMLFDESEDTDKQPLRTDNSEVREPLYKLQAEPDLLTLVFP